MSRRILNDHLWTADEVAYQLSRGRAKEVETNRQQWESVTPDVAVEDSPTLKLDTDIFDLVKAMSLEQLQSKLREVNINPVGDEKQLKVTLAQYLQNERDEEKRANGSDA